MLEPTLPESQEVSKSKMTTSSVASQNTVLMRQLWDRSSKYDKTLLRLDNHPIGHRYNCICLKVGN